MKHETILYIFGIFIFILVPVAVGIFFTRRSIQSSLDSRAGDVPDDVYRNCGPNNMRYRDVNCVAGQDIVDKKYCPDDMPASEENCIYLPPTLTIYVNTRTKGVGICANMIRHFLNEGSGKPYPYNFDEKTCDIYQPVTGLDGVPVNPDMYATAHKVSEVGTVMDNAFMVPLSNDPGAIFVPSTFYTWTEGANAHHPSGKASDEYQYTYIGELRSDLWN